MNPLSAVVGAAKVLAPSDHPPASQRLLLVERGAKRNVYLVGFPTQEEAEQAWLRAQRMERDGPLVGWGIGGALALLASIVGGRQRGLRRESL